VRILFDQGTPVPLRDVLTAHSVETTYERGWSTLENGELLTVAEQDGFEVLITTDLNLKHQQNLKHHDISIVVLTTPSWPRIQQAVGAIIRTIDEAVAGSYVEVKIP